MICVFVLLTYCFLGTLATDSYQNYADLLYETHWYKLPLNLQKLYILMIANAQKPIYYHGFGIIQLKLNIFIKVMIQNSISLSF